jgi:hypothetical protein
MALGDMSQNEKNGVHDLHEFWRSERKGLINFMKEKQELFEPKQAHINPEELKNPLGLYVLLKSKPGIKAQEIFTQTGTLGVDTPMGSGHYIRFSVGTLLHPTYSKYAN